MPPDLLDGPLPLVIFMVFASFFRAKKSPVRVDRAISGELIHPTVRIVFRGMGIRQI